ncbi:hypothetical protein MKK58_17645 [Methylobacterium sp. J-078]|uniref:hypothetical protein n=1 Tax=Methylobacterium sp. J-078 TaxID=2836657 RepID=UPI001FB9DEC7|nr:hypothetical protein [Methylobacterium sp. J-078]MCJ2046342.1 hypothetical protein [Methylobacterium sp. J-078]
MKIVLCPMDQPSDGEGFCIGTLDGHPLIVHDRKLYASGREYEHGAVANAYVEAVDRAASEVFGSDWVTPLARLMQINKRSTAKDRIAKFGLPNYVLQFLAKASTYPVPRALGYALLCVEEAQETMSVTHRAPTGRPLEVDVQVRSQVVRSVVLQATDLVDNILSERAAFRMQKPLTAE